MHGSHVIVYIASVHFGENADGTCYIHLNNAPPSDAFMNALRTWVADVEFRVMLGGAGGAYGALFEDATSYHEYYSLLTKWIGAHRDVIHGIDLDVEEAVHLDNIKMLIRDLKADMGSDFAVTMAPVAYAMETDSPGLGGFVYKDIYEDPSVGPLVDCFNVQCYQGSFSCDTFQRIVANGYAPEHLSFGMLGDEYMGIGDPSFEIGMRDLCRFRATHPSVQGVALWEFGDTKVDPIAWGQAVSAPHFFLTNTFVDQCERAVAEVTRALLLFLCHMIRHGFHTMRHFFYMLDTLHVASVELCG
jgi:hypothetical protein